jgi:uncharacterized protein YbaR (Trm112 family)
MHLGLTDRLFCPRCGPDFGLILLANRIQDRRVLEGELGCSNCRGTYPVREGYADLRISPRSPPEYASPENDTASAESEDIVRLGALLGIAQGPGTLLVKGPAQVHAQRLAELIGGVEIVVIGTELMEMRESDSVSRVIARPRIPFFSDTFRGILLSGKIDDGDLAEAARSAAPSARVVVLDAPQGSAQDAEALGLKVLLKEDGVLVVLKGRSQSLPLITLRGS